MRPAPLGNERGSITTFVIGTVVVGVVFLLVVANIGNIWLRRDAAQDSAEMLAPLLLSNQLTWRSLPGAPSTQDLTRTLSNSANADLAHSLGANVAIQYTFGTSNDGTAFSPPYYADPDPTPPKSEYFNAVAVEVRVPLINLGNLFGLNFGLARGRAIARLPYNTSPPTTRESCVCAQRCAAAVSGMPAGTLLEQAAKTVAEATCLLSCTLNDVLALLGGIFALDGPAILAALRCLFVDLDHIVLVAVSVWDWAWTSIASTTITPFL